MHPRTNCSSGRNCLVTCHLFMDTQDATVSISHGSFGGWQNTTKTRDQPIRISNDIANRSRQPVSVSTVNPSTDPSPRQGLDAIIMFCACSCICPTRPPQVLFTTPYHHPFFFFFFRRHGAQSPQRITTQTRPPPPSPPTSSLSSRARMEFHIHTCSSCGGVSAHLFQPSVFCYCLIHHSTKDLGSSCFFFNIEAELGTISYCGRRLEGS